MIAEKEVYEIGLVKRKYRVECHQHKNGKIHLNLEEFVRVRKGGVQAQNLEVCRWREVMAVRNESQYKQSGFGFEDKMLKVEEQGRIFQNKMKVLKEECDDL